MVNDLLKIVGAALGVLHLVGEGFLELVELGDLRLWRP